MSFTQPLYPRSMISRQMEDSLALSFQNNHITKLIRARLSPNSSYVPAASAKKL